MGVGGWGCCQAKQGFWSPDTEACPLGEKESRGRRVSATDMHQGAGWVGSELSSPNAPKAETHGLPDPPLPALSRGGGEKERLVPETVQQGGRSHSQHQGLWAPKDTH